MAQGNDAPRSNPDRPSVDRTKPSALGDDFSPGVHDYGGDPKRAREVETGKRLAQDGKDVTLLPEDHGAGKKNVDALVRENRDDPGRHVEFKELEPKKDGGTDYSRAVSRNIINAGEKLDSYGQVDAVIDGRKVGLTKEDAERGLKRALGTPGGVKADGTPAPPPRMPDRVQIILGDGSIHTWSKGT